MCCKFAKAHYKSTKPELTTIKVKHLYDLENLRDIPQRLVFNYYHYFVLTLNLSYM